MIKYLFERPKETFHDNKLIALRFKKNKVGRDFIVGDLHGMYDKLMSQLKALNFDPQKDRLFCAGDLIDRGPDSLKCLELIYEPWFACTLGNHERFMIEAILGKSERMIDFWVSNGGQWHYNEDAGYLRTIARDLNDYIPFKIAIGRNIGIVHADVIDDEFFDSHKLSDKETWELVESRQRFKGNKQGKVKDLENLYVGHCKTKDKIVIDNVHFMDSGAVTYGNDLRIEMV